jgi:hypothetical protein
MNTFWYVGYKKVHTCRKDTYNIVLWFIKTKLE